VNDRTRSLLLVVTGLVVVAVVVPPLSTEARRYEFVEAIQFSLAALAVPALAVLGAPWSLLRLAGGGGSKVTAARPFDRLASMRPRHPKLARSLVFMILDLLAMVAWRTPAAVDALALHPWLVAAELISLAVLGVGFWLEMLPSPPLAPRVPRPWRAVLATVALWFIWAIAYILGLSHVPWYQNLSGGGLGSSMDQQIITTGVLWFAAAFALIPVVFWDMMEWLRSEDDPDVEMHRLVREERRVEVRAAGASARRETRGTVQ